MTDTSTNAGSSKCEWLRRSRVLLFDASVAPFYPEIEFDARKIVGLCKEVGANAIRVGSIAKWAYYQTREMPMHPELGNRDLIREMVEVAHREGIRVVVHVPAGHGLPVTL